MVVHSALCYLDSWPDIMANVVGAGVQASTALAAVTILLLCLALLYIMCNDCGEDRYVYCSLQVVHVREGTSTCHSI